MLAIRLPEAIEERLNTLAREPGAPRPRWRGRPHWHRQIDEALAGANLNT